MFSLLTSFMYLYRYSGFIAWVAVLREDAQAIPWSTCGISYLAAAAMRWILDVLVSSNALKIRHRAVRTPEHTAEYRLRFKHGPLNTQLNMDRDGNVCLQRFVLGFLKHPPMEVGPLL